MSVEDTCCTILPYFQVSAGKLDDFRALCLKFMEKTKAEEGCLYYGFSFNGDLAHCREGYVDAKGLLIHLENVGLLLQEALTISELVRLEVHGPQAELAMLKKPLATLNPKFFTLEYGFRK